MEGNSKLTRGRGKYSCQETANHTSNAVQFEDVHTLINMQPIIHVLKKRADDGSDEAYDGREPRFHIASRWGNADQSSNGTFAGSHDTEFPTMLEIVNHYPSYYPRRSSGVRVEGCYHCPYAGIQSTSPVEAEPPEPNQNRAEEYECGIVRLAVGFIAGVLAFPEDERIGQC